MPSDRITALQTEWTRARTGALEFIDAMPDGLITFKPVPEVFTFAEQMVHIASVNYIFASGASGLDNPYDKAKGSDPEKNEEFKSNKTALREFAGGSYDFMIGAIQSLDAGPEGLLDEAVQFHKWAMPRVVMIGKALEHHAHHRGQTAVYFRLNGIKPPGERLF
jgi:uncharacterized damage-inducible protein DinB